MGRHIVCLTFDFDAMSGWIARGMASPTPISRGEFGPAVALPRILALLKKYDIPASWYIPRRDIWTTRWCMRWWRGGPRSFEIAPALISPSRIFSTSLPEWRSDCE